VPLTYRGNFCPAPFEHALNELLDHDIDLSDFDSRYCNDETGATGVPAGDAAQGNPVTSAPIYRLSNTNAYYNQGMVAMRVGDEAIH
jgi:hypothetical protein